MDDLRARITGNLAAFERVAIDPTGRRRAAVAIVLSPGAGGPTYLLTRRAMHLRRNAGNYALPGGGFDEGEDAVAAACRETQEEVGVDLPREAALGLLDDFVTLGGHVVTPVVLWSATPLVPVANPKEVHVVWQVPVSDLDHPRAPRRETPQRRPAHPAHVRPRRLGEPAHGRVPLAVPRGLPARPHGPHRPDRPTHLDSALGPPPTLPPHSLRKLLQCRPAAR